MYIYLQILPCAIKQQKDNSTICTNDLFFNNECLINLGQGSASQGGSL